MKSFGINGHFLLGAKKNPNFHSLLDVHILRRISVLMLSRIFSGGEVPQSSVCSWTGRSTFRNARVVPLRLTERHI